MARTPNDDRSDTMNPSNESYQDRRGNRSTQVDPNNKESGGEQAQQPSTPESDFAPGEDGERH